jgi:hypothetical protein
MKLCATWLRELQTVNPRVITAGVPLCSVSKWAVVTMQPSCRADCYWFKQTTVVFLNNGESAVLSPTGWWLIESITVATGQGCVKTRLRERNNTFMCFDSHSIRYNCLSCSIFRWVWKKTALPLNTANLCSISNVDWNVLWTDSLTRHSVCKR